MSFFADQVTERVILFFVNACCIWHYFNVQQSVYFYFFFVQGVTIQHAISLLFNVKFHMISLDNKFIILQFQRIYRSYIRLITTQIFKYFSQQQQSQLGQLQHFGILIGNALKSVCIL
ncbi:Hypothetical_protein [Hexamita inflata]|uniref:Hypothetical_protein n=1 Tax=Hexamita inflata TaxID=28002 RepID=A0AA86NZ15_9EUKA|nr:Hypothetical protein HINF_LOCUS15277 [Hexamita inflata]